MKPSATLTKVPCPRYIAIEGPIGVGKTTLTTLLAKSLSADPVLEEVEGNPDVKIVKPDLVKIPKRYSSSQHHAVMVG